MADWLSFRLTALYQALFSQYSNTGSKIPYTDAGIQIFNDATLNQLRVGVAIGHLADDPEPTVTTPRRSEVTPADLINRILRFTFNAEPAGAIHRVQINGTVAIPIA